MTTPITVSDSDLRIMLRVVNGPDLGEDGPGLPWSTLQDLETLIPCEWITFNGMDVAHHRHYFEQGTGGGERATGVDDADGEALFWFHYPSSHCSYPERSGDFCTVTMTTDFCTLQEHRRTPMYIDVMLPDGGDHEMMVCIPDGPGRQLRLLVWRGRADPDFTERDRALLTLLRPHLYAAHLRVSQRRVGTAELTSRQWELLRLVDAGFSNTQVARQLHIAENTVRKHLENIFLRLQVSSRTEALAKAFPERALAMVGGPDR